MMKLNIQLFATIGPTTNNPYYSGKTGTGSHSGGSNRFYWEVKVTLKSQTIGTSSPSTKFQIDFIETGSWGSYSGQNSTYTEIYYRKGNSSGTWGSWTRLCRDKSPSFNKGSTTTQSTATVTIAHFSDGTSPKIQFRGVVDTSNTQDWSPVDVTVNTTTLYAQTIPMASKINSVTVNKTAINFNYTKYSTSFTDTVTIKCGDTTLYTLENPLDSAITSTITKELTQSHIDTIVAYGNTNTLTQVPITIETITMNGASQVGTTQTVTVDYILTNSTLEAETSYAITNSAISVTPVFTQLSSSNLKHNLRLTYGENLTYTFENISSGSALALPINDPNIVGTLFQRFRSESSIDIRLSLVTQLGSSTTDIGSTSSKTLSLELPAYTITGAISSITENATMPTGLNKASNTFIKNLSKMSISFAAKKTDDNATSFYGTSIQYKIGNTLVSSPYIHSYDGTIPTIVAFTDLNDEVSMNISNCNYVNYQFPICSINAIRVDSQGAATQTGDRVKFEITIIYFKEQAQSPLITQYPHETPEFTLKYKEAGQSSWSSFTQSNTTINTSTDGNIVTKIYTKTLTGMHYNKQLSYELTGEDCLKQTITAIADKVIPGKPGIYGYKDDTTAENYTGINDHLILNGNMQVAVTSQHTGKNIIQGSANHSSTYTNTLPAKSGTFAMTDDHDSTKQDTLVSGTSIKTLNGESLLGSGNIVIQGAETTDVKINNVSITNNAVADIKTKSAYNASTNKLATESDIPTVNNAKLKITKNGNDFIEFTANASSNVTGNIDVPAKVSDLTNDLNFTSNTGTVTGVTAGAGLNTTGDNASSDGGTISTSGTLNLTKSGVTAGTYQGITVDKYGRVTAASNQGYTTNTGTITGVSVNGTSIATSGVANISSLPASILSGAIANGVTATTQNINDNSTKVATTAYVDRAINNLPEPMVFKGSLGTGGTITTLPTASSSNEGYTYKVITAGTYASQSAKIGDTFISDGSSWVLIPSGDEPSGTVTSITIKATSPISIDSSSAITSSGTRTLSHANSGVSAGTYKSVTVNATGHVTGGTNPTTLSGYGITDAKINNGVITLGSNSITPLTSYTETDPVFSASPAAGITAANITAWNNKSDFSGSYNDLTNKPSIPTKTSDLTNDSDFVSDNTYVHTDNNYTTTEKNKLSGIASGAQVNVIETIKVNNTAQTITSKSVNITVPTKTSDLTNDDNVVKDASYVHTDNNYTSTEKNKLSGIAAGAEVNVQSDWNQTTTTADDYIKNKPTIPTVNNGTLTIQKNGTNVQTFTANQSSNATANITVPTKVSDLTNDSGYTTNTGTITGVSINGSSVATSGVANITSIPTGILNPIATKTYTNIIGDSGANSEAGDAFYFGSIRPTSFTESWAVRYRIRAWVPGDTAYEAISDVYFTGDQASINAYAIFNHIYSTSYKPCGYHCVHRLKQAGYTAGYGHAFGVNLQDANNRDNTSKKRSITIELISQKNCTVTLNNTAVKWSAWTGTGTTNYNDIGNYNFNANGLQESGDNDSIGVLRSYYDRPLIGDVTDLFPQNLCSYTTSDKVQPFVNSYSTGTSKTKNTSTFRIGAPIYFYASWTQKAKGSNYPPDATMSLANNGISLQYSTNCGTSLVINKPVYLVGIPDGSTYTLDDTWWTQTLPVTEDGKIYIFLGYTYSNYQISWQPFHPVYWFKGGTLQLYHVETDPIFEASPASDISNSDISSWGAKQDSLISGENIKTINGEPIIGPGNIIIGEGGKLLTDVQINSRSITPGDTAKANIIVDGTYNESTNKIATQSTVTSGVAAGLSTIDYITCGNETFRNPFTGTEVTTEVITVGKRNNNVKLKLSNNIVKVALNNNDVVYIGSDNSGKTRIFANNMNALQSIKLGDFSWTKLSDGSIVFGGDE